MTTTKNIPPPIVTLKLPKSVPALLTYTQNIVQAMTANAATFGSPTPPLATLTSAATELSRAEAAALSRGKGAVSIRNEKRTALVLLLKQEASYVQHTADANLENGVSIIESAAMSVRKTTARRPKAFEVVAGPVSGSVKLVTKSAGTRASYEWQYSTDGGKTWLEGPWTLQAKTLVTGLTPATTVSFRYRALTKTGEGDWSQVVSLLVR
jgi:hypothetical protein